LKSVEDTWKPAIIKSVATENAGIDLIKNEIEKHRHYLKDGGRLTERRNRNLERRVKAIISDKLNKEIWDSSRSEKLSDNVRSLREIGSSPYKLAEEILNKIL
jgi:LAO/AO transport system kinase